VTSRSDNFNRADTTNAIGTPSDGGSAWSVQSGTWGIASNRGYTSAASTQGTCVLEASSAVVTVQATLATVGGNPGLVVRASDDNNYIVGVYATGLGPGMAVYKRVASNFIQLGSTYVGTVSANDVMVLDVDASNNIAWKQNGTSRVTAADSHNSTATKHGIRAHEDTTSRFEDFSITDNGGGGGGTSAAVFYFHRTQQGMS